MIFQGALEHDIVQNDALGGLAVWSFAGEYYKATSKKQGAPFPLAMIVLPIVHHADSVAALSTRSFDGGIYIAINEDRSLFAGLQERMQAMANQSMSAINLALAAGLLRLDEETSTLIPVRATEPKEVMTEDIARILATARRLGYWAAQIGSAQLLNVLDVRL